MKAVEAGFSVKQTEFGAFQDQSPEKVVLRLIYFILERCLLLAHKCLTIQTTKAIGCRKRGTCIT